jgi:hypothetical protein
MSLDIECIARTGIPWYCKWKSVLKLSAAAAAVFPDAVCCQRLRHLNNDSKTREIKASMFRNPQYVGLNRQ